eukprot:TRINITY_DN3807_c0_g1_i1.p1 TRINITY_DN3807_c0_g1~~TRINITY_DN3807_c0_g1_i1.p1  ORF type:complete len:210 (+),score=82.74 TRINITY_DN3807_c0_g1_i1:44-673(+)
MTDLIHRIQGIVLLDGENGKRLFAKYYGEPFEGVLEKQRAFEEKLYAKTHNGGSIGSPKDGGDITLVDAHTVVFRLDPEIHMYVVGSVNENEIMISSVLVCLENTLGAQIDNRFEKRELLENFDVLTLIVDEMIDDGIILQDNPAEINQLLSDRRTKSGNLDLQALKKLVKKSPQGDGKEGRFVTMAKRAAEKLEKKISGGNDHDSSEN